MVGFSLFFILLQSKFNITMRYQKIIFHITPWTQDAEDIVLAMAGEAGCESFEDHTAYVQTDLLDTTLLDELLNNFPMPHVTITYDISDVEVQNWNEEWENAGFSPIDINGKCIIYDARHTDDSRINALSERTGTPTDTNGTSTPPLLIGIEARQAFGTGTHETTRMIVTSMFDLDISGKRILDCGCGTGILGIVAAKLGASEVDAYDIDDWSVANTRHNAELNHVDINVWEGTADSLTTTNHTYDIVLANINRNILLADMPTFKAVLAPNGTLILSGFYETDAAILIEQATRLGLREEKRIVDADWCCLILRHEHGNASAI